MYLAEDAIKLSNGDMIAVYIAPASRVAVSIHQCPNNKLDLLTHSGGVSSLLVVKSELNLHFEIITKLLKTPNVKRERRLKAYSIGSKVML